MHSAIRTAILIAMGPIFGIAETPDLKPLLPPTTPSNKAVVEALEAGAIPRAEALAGAQQFPDREEWRGIFAIIRNDPTTAIRALRRANDPKALGVAYYLARQYLLFREQMNEAIRRNPQDFGPYYFLGRHYDSDLDNCDEAARWFRKAQAREPSYARTHAYLGGCLERLGKMEEAEIAYRASSSLPFSQLGLARLRVAAGKPVEALDLVERALLADPYNAAGQRLAARLYEAAERPREAIRALAAAAKAAPQDAAIHYQLYRLHRSAGDEAEAARALREYERLRAVYGSQPQ